MPGGTEIGKGLTCQNMCKQVLEFTHFACTSEDINNLAYALMLKEAVSQHVLPTMDKVSAVAPHAPQNGNLSRVGGQIG